MVLDEGASACCTPSSSWCRNPSHTGLAGSKRARPHLFARQGWHDEATTARYAALASELGLLVTGGSDFHDPASSLRPGAVTLPQPHWDRLLARRSN